jgi:hypothetical protein
MRELYAIWLTGYLYITGCDEFRVRPPDISFPFFRARIWDELSGTRVGSGRVRLKSLLPGVEWNPLTGLIGFQLEYYFEGRSVILRRHHIIMLPPMRPAMAPDRNTEKMVVCSTGICCTIPTPTAHPSAQP